MGRTRGRISLILWMLYLCVMGAVSTVREIHGEFTALIRLANYVSVVQRQLLNMLLS